MQAQINANEALKKLKCFFLDMKKAITHFSHTLVSHRPPVTTYFRLFQSLLACITFRFSTVSTSFQPRMSSPVARSTSTVSNEWFTPTPASGYSKQYNRHKSGRHHRPRRSAEQQARHQAAKDEHIAAVAAADDGEWVVKGKRHNKVAPRELTNDEKAELARKQAIKDLEAIQKTISGSMSVIRERKRQRKNGSTEQKRRRVDKDESSTKTKKKISASNAFAMLSVDSTDDEAETVATSGYEVQKSEFPSLAAPASTPSRTMNYSNAAKQTVAAPQPIGPQDFPDPPKTSIIIKKQVPSNTVSWADWIDEPDSDDEYDDDDFPIPPEAYDFN